MNDPHFMRDDLVGVVLGTLALAPFLLTPGYMIGWLCDLFQFRQQSRPWRVLLSLPLSLSMAPILVFLIGSFISNRAVWLFYAFACAFALFIEVFGSKSFPGGTVPRWIGWPLLGWAAVVWVSGIDLQFGNRLYLPAMDFDFNLRTEFVEIIARRGLPASNPLYFPGHAVLLRYHYLWFIAPAYAHRLGGSLIESRHALTAADVWCGWALMALVVLYLRYFHVRAGRLEERARWGIALISVAGLDLLPNLAYIVLNRLSGWWPISDSAEWWNNQVDAFPNSVLLEAHHVAGMIACLMGFLILWRANRVGRFRMWASAICAGICFASGAGLSIYVTFTFAIFLTAWGLVILLFRDWNRRLTIVLSASTATALAMPYLVLMRGAGGLGSSVIGLTVRGFSLFELLLPGFGYTWNQIAIMNFVVLPFNYFLETGVWYLLVRTWWVRLCRRRWRLAGPTAEAYCAALMMFGISLLVGTFLRSTVIRNNDLGWRSLLIAQFIILIYGTDLVRAWWRCRAWSHVPSKGLAFGSLRKWRFRVATLLLLGLGSTTYDFLSMRIFAPLSDAGLVPPTWWLPHEWSLKYRNSYAVSQQLGQRDFSARAGYQTLRKLVSEEAVFQANPNVWNDVYHGLYALHQEAAFDLNCGSAMGGNPVDCVQMQKQLNPLFNDPGMARSLDIDQVCANWGIDVLIAKDTDPIFYDVNGWIWKRPPLVAGARLRAVSCGTNKTHLSNQETVWLDQKPVPIPAPLAPRETRNEILSNQPY